MSKDIDNWVRIWCYFANSIDHPKKRQNFLTQKLLPQRQGTSHVSFRMFLSLNIFWNVNFDYQFIKPLKVLIFECAEKFSAQISLTQKKRQNFFSAQILTSKTKHFPYEYLDLFEPEHIQIHQSWLLALQTIQNIDIWLCGKFFHTIKTNPYNCLCLCLCIFGSGDGRCHQLSQNIWFDRLKVVLQWFIRL